MDNENQEGTQGAAEQEPVELTEVEVDAAFDEGAGSETEVVDVAPVGGINDNEETPAASGADDDEAAKAAAVKAEEDGSKTDDDGGKQEPTRAELQADNERLTKEAADNQKYGRTESEKNAELTKEIETLKAGKQEEVDPLADAPDDVKEYLDDNPEISTIVEKLADHRVEQIAAKIEAKYDAKFQQLETVTGQQRFDNQLVNGFRDENGVHVPGHPDAMQIIHSDEFQEFIKSSKTGDISAPDAIDTITKFKTSKAAAAADDHDKDKGEKGRKQAQDYSGAAGGELGKGTKEGTGKRPSEDNKTGDDWFNEGATEEAQTLQ